MKEQFRGFTLVILMLPVFSQAAVGQENGRVESKSEASGPGFPAALSAGSRDLKPAILVSPGKPKPHENTVFVYYANEPELSGVSRIADWLAEIKGRSDHSVIAESMRKDAKLFPEQVRTDIAGIEEVVRSDKNVCVFVFTNELARQSQFQFWDFGSPAPQTIGWKPAKTSLSAFNSHPLAHPVTLSIALKSAFKQLAGSSDQEKASDAGWVLVTKSHGTPKLAVAQAYAAFYQANTADQFQSMNEAVLAISTDGKTGQPRSKTQAERSFDQTLLKEWNVGFPTKYRINKEYSLLAQTDTKAQSGVGDERTPKRTNEPGMLDPLSPPGGDDLLSPPGGSDPLSPPGGEGRLDPPGGDGRLDPPGGDGRLGPATQAAKRLCGGISKDQYLTIITNAALNHGIYFDTLFLESCKSDVAESSLRILTGTAPQGVGRIYVSDQTGLQYDTIEYGQLVMRTGEGPFANRLRAFLDRVQQ